MQLNVTDVSPCTAAITLLALPVGPSVNVVLARPKASVVAEMVTNEPPSSVVHVIVTPATWIGPKVTDRHAEGGIVH